MNVNAVKCIIDIFPDEMEKITDISLSIASFFAAMGANIHANDESILRDFAYIGDESAVRFMVDRGADIHVENDWPLHLAVQYGHYSIVRYLIEHGANIKSREGWALSLAAFNGHEYIVRYLIDQGADIHAEDDSALRHAVIDGHESIVKILIDNGANVHAENDYAITTAIHYGHESIVRILSDPRFFEWRHGYQKYGDVQKIHESERNQMSERHPSQYSDIIRRRISRRDVVPYNERSKYQVRIPHRRISWRLSDRKILRR